MEEIEGEEKFVEKWENFRIGRTANRDRCPLAVIT